MVSEPDFENMTRVVWSCMRIHCKGVLDTWLTFKVLSSFVVAVFCRHLCVCLWVAQAQFRLWEVEENLPVIQVN